MRDAHFRIVETRKGDVSTGYRVQQLGWSRRNVHDTDNAFRVAEVWRNRGKRLYTLTDARRLRDFLMEQAAASAVAETTYLVE